VVISLRRTLANLIFNRDSLMPHAYTEDLLVEQPAIGLFAELGWTVAQPPPSAAVGGEPRDAGLLGRETKARRSCGVPVARGVGAVESRAAAGGPLQPPWMR